MSEVGVNRPGETPTTIATERDPGDGRLRILLVDDDVYDRLAVRRCLSTAGLDVAIDEAESAAQTLERVGRGGYDCVFLDYYLPAVDGLALLRAIGETARDVPVVIFTGRGDEEIAVELMKAGAADYLPKAALTPERLVASLRHATKLGRAAAARREAEETLRQREEEFRTIVNTIPQLAWISDEEGRRSWFNDQWYAFSGLGFEESRDLGWQRLHHPDHLGRVRTGLLAAFRRGEAWEDTYPLRRRDGVYRWFLSRATPLPGTRGGKRVWFGTNTDIDERLAADGAVREALALERAARDEAERATRLRDEVLGIVAHDLRNPLNAISMSATMLEDALPEDRRARQVKIIRRSAKAMDHLIRDLLDVTLIEAKTFSIRRAPFDLVALLDEAREQLEGQARSREIALTCAAGPDLPPVSGDRNRLAQVLSNLLGNALKFTPPRGRVGVLARRAGTHVEVCVEDTGPGISQEHLAHVFDRFWQAERATGKGAGLGLAIAKGIVEAHGGTITVESGPGGGTTVRFTVPCAGAGAESSP